MERDVNIGTIKDGEDTELKRIRRALELLLDEEVKAEDAKE